MYKIGEYHKLSRENKATIAKYASKHGVANAVRKFEDKNAGDSSIRDW